MLTSDNKTNSFWSLDQIKDYFKTYSHSYDKGLSKETYPAPFIIGTWIKEKLDQGQVKIMDLGCGTGARLFFDDKRFEVHGIDATLEMLEKAKKLPFKSLHCQNIEETLNTESDAFDAVVSVGLFDFIVNRKIVMNEISRILKKGGIAGVTIPTTPLQMQVDPELRDILMLSGLEVIKSEQFFGYKSSIDEEEVYFLGILLKKI